MLDLKPLYRIGLFTLWSFAGSFITMILALFGVYWMYALIPFIGLSLVGLLQAWRVVR